LAPLQYIIGSKTKLLRIALHLKDPSKALIDQKNMILKLKEEDYTFLQYSQIREKKLGSSKLLGRDLNLCFYFY